MAWTGSTRPPGRFARFADVVWPFLEPVLPQTRLAAASLIQLVLVAALAISFIGGEALTNGEAFDGLALLALVSASVVAFIVVRHDRADPPFEAPGPDQTPRRGAAPLVPRADLIGDADQIAQLTARVSHELRTPLNAVIGFAELMHCEALGPVGNDRYREYAGHIRRSAEHFQWATERTLAVTELLTSPRRQVRSAIQLRDVAVRAFERAQAEQSGSGPITGAISIDDQLEVEGCHEALDHSLQYLVSAALAIAGSQLGAGSIAISCATFDCGQLALRVRVALAQAEELGLGLDGERAPGAELSLLLARLGLETAGGRLDAEIIDGHWQATAWLAQARQREFPLI